MLAAGRRFQDRTWAVEGCNGIGKHIAHRLVHDGDRVLECRQAIGSGATAAKTDSVAAHSVALESCAARA
jgi:transposase